MKILQLIVILCIICFAGCMNLYVRCPGTSEKIEKTYQCTEKTFALSYVVMFPQVMAPGEHDSFVIENLLTIPIGCLCFIDVACEGIVDTLLWPIDKAISNLRCEKITFCISE